MLPIGCKKDASTQTTQVRLIADKSEAHVEEVAGITTEHKARPDGELANQRTTPIEEDLGGFSSSNRLDCAGCNGWSLLANKSPAVREQAAGT